MKKVVLLFLTLLIITACTPEERFQGQLNEAMEEKFEYKQFTSNGFTIKYPNWPTTGGDTEVSVTKGFCSVSINEEKIPAKQWYNMMQDAIKQQEGQIIEKDEENYYAKYTAKYQNFTMIAENKFIGCNDKTFAVTITCIDQAKAMLPELHNEIYTSANCQQEEQEYKTFQEEDFSLEYPKWKELEQEAEQRILGKTQGVCSVIIDKHNARPNDILNWIKQNNNGVTSTNDQITYTIDKMTATAKITYCNYQSYITQVVCTNELMTEELEEIQNKVLTSVACAKQYEIPTEETIQQKKEQIQEEMPQIVEEIESIVKTNIGEEFGIDEEVIVYFINNNAFFTKVLKDFPKVNIKIKDDERTLELKATIDNTGKITSLEDGQHSDANVTLIIPLQDALNIFSNANNINPQTLLSLAINVQTEPREIKNEVIQKAIRGEYN